MLNRRIIVTGSNVVYCGSWKEFDREDARKTLVGHSVAWQCVCTLL